MGTKVLELSACDEANRIVEDLALGGEPFEAKLKIYECIARAQRYYYMYVQVQARLTVLDVMMETGALKPTIPHAKEYIDKRETECLQSSLRACGFPICEASRP